MAPIDAATGLFEAHRPRLVRLAYRMLGSMAEADDVVQEAGCAGGGSTRPRLRSRRPTSTAPSLASAWTR